MNATQAADVLDRRSAQIPETTPRDEPAAQTPEPAQTDGARSPRDRDANGMAVASFVLGLTGLLVFNLVLGPIALVLGGLALLRGTTRRGRAALGIALGAADLVVLGALIATSGTMSWSITG